MVLCGLHRERKDWRFKTRSDKSFRVHEEAFVIKKAKDWLMLLPQIMTMLDSNSNDCLLSS